MAALQLFSRRALASSCPSHRSLHRLITKHFWKSCRHSAPIVELHRCLFPITNEGHQRYIYTASCVNGKTVPFLLSDIGEGIREVVLKEWFVEEGDTVAQFDQICEVQSDKASVTITSRYDGVVKKRHYQLEQTALVGAPLVDIELQDGATESTVASHQVDDIAGSSLTSTVDLLESGDDVILTEMGSGFGKVLATPAVRRIAGENKVNLSEVIGTGKDGRVMKEDIVSYIDKVQGRQQPVKPIMVKREASTKTEFAQRPSSSVGEDRVEPLRGIRKAMAKSMAESLKIPHFGYSDEIDMTELVTLRQRLKGSAILGSIPFSYMPVIIKATSLVLKEFPILNSSLMPSGEEIKYKASHNIGFAMDSPDGLIVPNIKNVQDLTVLEIAAQMARLINLGESGKLGPNDVTGGTFSLSNIGSIGGTYASPVIMSPEVAIGALGKIQTLPRFNQSGELVKSQIMKVSWSADHRVIEGAQMARFSNRWKEYLENPSWLMLNMR